MQDLKELNEVITAIKEEIRQGADALTTSKSVYEFKKTFLDNKQGRIGLLMKEMRNVANDQKAEFGKTINGAKEWANNFFDELDQKLKEKEQQQRYESEKIDITMPPVKIRYGNLHPVTTVRNQLTDIFTSMGFEVYEGTEIETDYYNFTALNTPQDHPARDMQDTFYLSPEFLLRTRHRLDKFMLWKRKNRRSRLFPRVRYSVLTMMRPILRCSARWKVWLLMRASPCVI